MDITLKDILRDKKKEIKEYQKKEDIRQLKDKIARLPSPRNFKSALEESETISIIAEIKTRSPSEGSIKDIDVIEIAKKYQKSRAAAISVLTDQHFGGKIEYLREVKEHTDKPILRKDFIIDEYQIYQSRAYGADAILLIVSILKDKNILKTFYSLCKSLNMDCLFECHTKDEIEKVPAEATLYGINNRDLNDGEYKTDLRITEKLVEFIPDDKIIISESGFSDSRDVKKISKLSRVNAILIGTSIIKEDNPIEAIDNLLSG